MDPSDVPMLDSPASTPDPKKQAAGPSSASAPNALPSEIAMMVDNQATSNGATTNWDTKKWRDELNALSSKLLHQNFNQSMRTLQQLLTPLLAMNDRTLTNIRLCPPTAKYRDPLTRPLVRRPNGLTPELEERLRTFYFARKAEVGGA